MKVREMIEELSRLNPDREFRNEMKIPTVKTIQGDCLESLRQIPDRSVHMCVTSPPYWGLRSYLKEGHPLKALEVGQERTPQEYVAKMVAVFAEVKRVLRDDGTCWLNLGSSYWHENPCGPQGKTCQRADQSHSDAPSLNFKPKDMVPIPWMVAMALQADGWYLRSDIIWSKPNPMPESVTDRPTKAHEYVFLLSKSARYWYDAEAIAERHISDGRGGFSNKETQKSVRLGASHAPSMANATVNPNGRNRRSVWTIPTTPYSEAHFATYPPALVKPCILSGTSQRGVCPKCGDPWERVVKNGQPDMEHRAACGADSTGGYNGKATKDFAASKAQDASAVKARILAGMVEKITTGWKPGCDCGMDPVPATVLDPFLGSGTTARVAMELGRSCIGLELNPDYLPLIEDRTNVTPGLAL